MLCHVSYVIGGQPYCTPTFFWREGTLYWHGSSASRAEEPVRRPEGLSHGCASRSLVLARCGFNHSADYRAVMAFGTAYLVTDADEKERALVAMVDRFFPDRTASLRQSSAQEIKATSVIAMEIEEASAKIRSKGVADDDEDTNYPSMPSAFRCAPCWAGQSPVHGFSMASSGRCEVIRKAFCSKMHCGMRILRITPAAEIGLG
jgi:nitroimidazol reductase NimA-like FMN-containing flavoprotein (pyridoxamine 5'-phosphate oxidase superfamily)